ncbi:hypothetical protein O7614_26805 [Micromonospora sp. WMMD961]|uniref:hypothetical protein n=1 Tax=Micromonospora sp. WMMD961 TaxID=3016100 RepID=UPI00241757CD|nr:hypothetical protein [Micromonospora sp. WMMD961]MDG4783275.1 hypothetical protein [Micromonospora sp. WMMD961]
MHQIIDVIEASADKRTYGITHRGVFVHEVSGKGLHNRQYPHRVQVWDNTGRPNPRNGEPVRYGQYGRIDGGDGKYLDPNHNATDEPVTVLLSAESIAITNNGTNTGTWDGGQPFGAALKVGEAVRLRYMDGTLSDPYVVTTRPLADPVLIPEKVTAE